MRMQADSGPRVSLTRFFQHISANKAKIRCIFLFGSMIRQLSLPFRQSSFQQPNRAKVGRIRLLCHTFFEENKFA